ncbi:hypothetical protein RhiirC2_803905 [Rhizophagus irregularis]|uniref:Uncharacterized protein n=1 Tax=Rhizophagus irregularis TaxID=588596 RepID=A0A2N1L8E1_9GLOM|nr:hypothetical protein RhiirC2_803905 [Rhizophagus irregularis]
MYYSGEGNNCQHECRRISSCKENCANYSLSNNIKNYYDMHLCKISLLINALASHTTRLNLSCQTRNNIIIS